MQNIDWKLEGISVVTCNCDFSCPCQFNALPTHGDCRAAIGYEVEHGYFGDTPLDGVRFITLYAWPGAIHEGRGEAQLIVVTEASAEQRDAIDALFRGEHTDPGAIVLQVFSTVVDTWHPLQVQPVAFEADIGERTAHFGVPGVLEAVGEPIRNPITGQAHSVRVTLPQGFEYHEAEYGASRVSTERTAIPLNWDGSHAHFFRVEWTPQGVVRP